MGNAMDTQRQTDVEGVFEPERTGGFLRARSRNYAVHQSDAFVGPDLTRRFNLCGGEIVRGRIGGGAKNRSGAVQVSDIVAINDRDPGVHLERKPFKDLTVISPHDRIRFETKGGPPTMRVVDLMTPIGQGQRALIVAAPRTGKTILLQQMAAGVAANYPDMYMMVLLIDERPEEVTDMQRTVHGEVVHSSNDRDIASHVRIARLMIESAKRRVECGQHVFVLLDSLTRLGRAFNAFIRGSGRIMSGGLDIRALEEPKSLFGAARNIENGGSLTIVGSVLIDTGSRMDEVIFNEFKGTGNTEIMLCRELANKRIWPAIDLQQSGTRKEELLLNPTELKKSHDIRRSFKGRLELDMTMLLESLARHPTNDAFVAAR
ncbi:MAG: transcription termination factor Rho [Phycisphaerales bacterium]|nr:transcription termination factor Rho [Phycisphaerales bacterium]